MPGWSSYRERERATINWQWLRSVVLELFGLKFAEGLEAATRTAATNQAVPRASTQKILKRVQPKAVARLHNVRPPRAQTLDAAEQAKVFRAQRRQPLGSPPCL